MREYDYFARITLIAISIFALSVPVLADDSDSEEDSAYDSVRIENEFKLGVPSDSVEPLWIYLQKRYQAEDSLLKKLSSDFKVTVSDENFIDRYFDTADLKLLSSQSGVRHRSRFIPGDEANRKHGRSLVQLKLKRPDDTNQLNRSELKFKVDNDLSNPMSASLSKLVKKSQQESFVKRLKDHGLQLSSLEEKLILKQRRRRVYIEYSGKPFATITLDEVRSKKLWYACEFTEVEIELNELNFTRANEKERIAMEKVTTSIMSDILASFPTIKQDQTPKYNKAYNALFSQGKVAAFLMKYF